MFCPRCNKVLDPGDLRCGGCGWTRAPERQPFADTWLVQQETFRTGSTVLPFISSGLILGFLAFLIAMVEINDRYHSATPWFFVVFLAIYGPVISTVQIIRHYAVWVRIEPDRGLVLSGGRTIAWREISHIDHYAGVFSYSDRFGRGMSGHAAAAAIKLSCIAVPALLLWYVFLPVLLVLSPWHARVTVTLSGGGKVMLRDLARSRDFCMKVNSKISAPGRLP